MLGAMSPTSLFNTHYNAPGPAPTKQSDSGSAPTTRHDAVPAPTKERVVKAFLSYSHRDEDVARTICQRLVEQGLAIVVDSGALAPGRNIQDFIELGVRSTDATISLISKYSLVSAWVALESDEALNRQRTTFFACYVDDEFLKRAFVDEALDYADSELRAIGDNIKSRIDRGHNFQDLYADLQRYHTLRGNIDKVIARIRATACLDFRANVFDQNVLKLANALKQLQ
jgi:hypothetical protein